MEQIELKDIQGIVARGYGSLSAARFVVFSITNGPKAGQWLDHMLDKNEITPGTERPTKIAQHLAFTAEGLRALGIREEIQSGFSEDFLAGMTTPHKQRTLGDHSASDPDRWEWGGGKGAPVHGLLLLYAHELEELETICSELSSHQNDYGLEIITMLDSALLPDHKEHFGFRDGIAQPYLRELKPGRNMESVPFGEFVLGYKNAYDLYTQRPLIEDHQEKATILPEDPEGSGKRDLGKNGTYLVFRQMEQDVQTFWRFLQEQSSDESTAQEAIYLASKMVGRWPSGAPLVKAPTADQQKMRHLDRFGYHQSDPKGHKCPLGAHIRRTNPRDSLEPEPGTQKSTDFSNRHRILRRGRAYGAPLSESMSIEEMIEKLDTPDTTRRGLHFICLNTNIGRQFEFVQHTWSNNPNFNGLYHDPDPLTGDRGTNEDKRNTFTIQSSPVRKQICNMPDFVTVRGGAYFFLPGLRALRYLASIASQSEAD